MSPRTPHPLLSASAGVLALAAALAGCGQKGPLYLPDTPAAAQRATLPQTVFGGATGKAPARTQTTPVPPAPAVPDLPDIE
jgi:predicted small lipoprotein YifL